MKKLFIYFLFLVLSVNFCFAENYPEKKVLVLVEGEYNLTSFATSQGRQLAQLLGHFKTNVTITGMAKYKPHLVEDYDYVFYVGYTDDCQVPNEFCSDVLATKKPVIWINTGFFDFSKKFDVEKRFGFSVTKFETEVAYNEVKAGDVVYSKGIQDVNVIQIKDKNAVEVWATALASKLKKETPYMIKSGNLTYIADSPFLSANETDRYLLFCDKLHDILNELHETKHQALLRIEDVSLTSDPNAIRRIADLCAEKKVPFLIAFVPIFVNQQENIRITLSERPEMVDALKYAILNGATIVMHGVTHQNKGLTADDFEFWDAVTMKPIKEQTTEDVDKKIEMGLKEFFKNEIYPMAWETPHYTGSVVAFKAIAKHFSTAIEQRLAIDDFDNGQYFPYIIEKDIYGQRILPENLGYVPYKDDVDSSKIFVENIIENSEMMLHVRDGFASCFFHPFLDLSLLEQLIDGIQSKGFTFTDIRQYTNWAKTKDQIALSGNQKYKITIDNSYLYEIYYDGEGNATKRIVSPERVNGEISKEVTLEPGTYYIAEGIDYKIKEPTWKDNLKNKFNNLYHDVFGSDEWREAKVSICWNQYAQGAAYKDQSSLAAMFKSLNINVDTIFIDEDMNLEGCNLLVVPYSCIDSLTHFKYDDVIQYVKNGGNLITDRQNKLIEKLGIRFYPNELKVFAVRDKLFPQEYIVWKNPQLVHKFDYSENDEIFCEDPASGIPLVLGKEFGKGKILFFNTAFDQNSTLGYSNYPFGFEYVKKYFQLFPVFKRENLEFFFDPGLRPNASIENLIKMWIKQGIRIIHVSGWHQYPSYTYDYERLIKLAHENGIIVYAWLEPPQVSQKFWLDHPEWREKNHKGEDVRPSWRYPVAMTDDKCLTTFIKMYIDFLKSYDFDGVNVAEIYFEAGDGFNSPDLFTPMHPSACNDFKQKYGFDMKQVFNPSSQMYWKRNLTAKENVINYRVDKIAYIQDKIMKAIDDYSKTKSGFGVMFTFMDTYFSPEIREQIGVSSDKVVELQKKYGFLLQVEDPQNKWSKNPYRYVEMGKLYSQKIDSSKLLLDLNILVFRTKEEVTPFPTLIQTGIESYHLANFAALGAPRFTVYSEASCNAQDMNYFAYASSSPVKYYYTENGYEVSSPYSFVMQLPKHIKIIKVDNQSIIGYRDNSFFIPAGDHTIEFHNSNLPGFSTVELQPQVLSFTGNLLTVKYDMRKLFFDYESHERALISLNSKPTTVLVDGKAIEFSVMKGIDCYSIFLPAGKHKAEIVTGDKFSYGLNLTSLWSISAIAIYGMFAVILLVIMYLILKVFRKKLEQRK